MKRIERLHILVLVKFIKHRTPHLDFFGLILFFIRLYETHNKLLYSLVGFFTANMRICQSQLTLMFTIIWLFNKFEAICFPFLRKTMPPFNLSNQKHIAYPFLDLKDDVTLYLSNPNHKQCEMIDVLQAAVNPPRCSISHTFHRNLGQSIPQSHA